MTKSAPQTPRKTEIGSTHSVFCFTSDDIWQYRYGKLEWEKRTAIYEHLQWCCYCQETFLTVNPRLPEAQEELKKAELPENAQKRKEKIFEMIKRNYKNQKKVKFEVPAEKARGQVWICEPGYYGIGGPVLIIYAPDKESVAEGEQYYCRAVSLSGDFDFKMPEEATVEVDFHHYKKKLFIPVINEFPCLETSLSRYAGVISDEDFDKVRKARNLFLDGIMDFEESPEMNRWRKNEWKIYIHLAHKVNDYIWLDDEPEPWY